MKRRWLAAVAAALLAGLAISATGGARPAPARAQSQSCEPDHHSYAAALKTPPRLDVPPGYEPASTAVLDLAARPTPIDVFFVLDSSPSMGPVFQSLKDSIAQAGDDLRATGIDIWAGVADFADIYIRPYRLDVPLAPLTCKLAQGVARIQTANGGQEDHRLAMEQAVTGDGQPDVDVPPGRGAAWRPHTLRLLFQVSDTGVDEGLPYSPSYAQLVKMFVDRRVHHVGVHVVDVASSVPTQEGEPNGGRAQSDMEALSRDTDTLAPAEGLDCNGDGIPEVGPGAPVVCPWVRDPVTTSMGEVVKQVVQTLRSTTDVELAVVDSGAIKVEVQQPVRSIDVATRSQLAWWWIASCPDSLLGKTVPVRFAARIAGETVAESTTDVTCVHPGYITRYLDVPGAAVAPQSIAPRPAVAPGAAPVPSQVIATAQSPAQSPVFGVALTPQEELQLARANAGRSLDDGEATRAAAALLGLGVAAALRRRTAPARSRSRRR